MSLKQISLILIIFLSVESAHAAKTTKTCSKLLDFNRIMQSKEVLEVVRPAGKAISFRALGRKMTAYVQEEKELRVEVPSQSGGTWDGGMAYSNMRELTSALLSSDLGGLNWPENIKRARQTQILFEPLAEAQVTYHVQKRGSETVFLKLDSAKVGRLNLHPLSALIRYEHPDLLNPEEDIVRVRAKVGHRREVGTYFDTSHLSFLAQNTAIRLKRWFPGEATDSELLEPVFATLFVKKILSSRSQFTEREEWQVPLYSMPTPAEIQQILSSFIEVSTGVKVGAEEIIPILTVDTKRFGFNLVLNKKIKGSYNDWQPHQIGFATVDAYHPVSADGVKTGATKFQIEIEVFPDAESQLLFQKNEELFKSLQEYLLRAIPGAQVMKTPKYITGFHALKP